MPQRLMGVIQTIVAEAPLVVCLQEVIEPTLKMLHKFLHPMYEFHAPQPGTELLPYFCVMLV